MNNYCEPELDYELKEVPVTSQSSRQVEEIEVIEQDHDQPDPHELRNGSNLYIFRVIDFYLMKNRIITHNKCRTET